MEERIDFENFLYGDGMEIIINDIGFVVDRIIMLPKIRPHKIEQAVSLSIEYCRMEGFRQKILEKSKEFPVLVYRLFKRGVFVLEEIIRFVTKCHSIMLCKYFRKEIECYPDLIKNLIGISNDYKAIFEIEVFNDQIIEYGFCPSSIEYCLKYDVIDDLIKFQILKREAEWSQFEWSNKPGFLDLLSFSGYFGSIRCFKHLLLNGFEFNDYVVSMVVCSGSLDLLHLIEFDKHLNSDTVSNAVEFCHLPILTFMLENGIDINYKNKDFNSLLGLAAKNGHLSIVQFLVNQKVDLELEYRGVEFFIFFIHLFI